MVSFLKKILKIIFKNHEFLLSEEMKEKIEKEGWEGEKKEKTFNFIRARIINLERSILAFLALCFFLLILSIRYYTYKTKPTEPLTIFNLDFYKFSWVLAFSSLGFSLIAFEQRYNPDSPFPAYFIKYPLLIFAVSCLVFAISHILIGTSEDILFYPLSLSLSLFLSYNVDNLLKILGR